MRSMPNTGEEVAKILCFSYNQKIGEAGIIIYGPVVSSLPYVLRAF